MLSRTYDVAVVGGGIVGTAVARELLQRHPRLKLAVIEKENDLAKHQSGNNSGVIHSGIYYTPGSLKARLCIEGQDLIYKYCDEKQVPYKRCGKMIVARNEDEIPKLHFLFERGKQNGAKDLTLVDFKGIQNIEPKCKGVAAIWCPNTGIVDWAEVTRSFGRDCVNSGASIYFDFCVEELRFASENYPITVCGKEKALKCKYIVTCGGLYSDKLAMMSGCSRNPKIIPVRGDFLLVKPGKQKLVQTNIYPVPDVRLPYLDVHFTPRMDGSVWIGPNAIVSLKREGYRPTDIDLREAYDMLSYRGFQKMALIHWSYGIRQAFERINLTLLVSRLRTYIPDLKKTDLIRGPSGVRAQALNEKGELVDDFVFDSGPGPLNERILHVRNAPSPAATSSLAIAKTIVQTLDQNFHLHSLNAT